MKRQIGIFLASIFTIASIAFGTIFWNGLNKEEDDWDEPSTEVVKKDTRSDYEKATSGYNEMSAEEHREHKNKLKDEIDKLENLSNEEKLHYQKEIERSTQYINLHEILDMAIEKDEENFLKKELEEETTTTSSQTTSSNSSSDSSTTSSNSSTTTQSNPTVTPKQHIKTDSRIISPKQLTKEATDFLSTLEFTYIGDSLGVGTAELMKHYAPKANFDVLSSRFLNSPWNLELDGMTALDKLKSEGKIKSTVVIALGTNGGITEEDLTNFIQKTGASTVILVNTSAEIYTKETTHTAMNAVAAKKDNVFVLDWYSNANSWGWNEIKSPDKIHMTNYKPYVDFQMQGIYQVFNSN